MKPNENHLAQSVGKRIRYIRIEKGISRNAVSQLLRISLASISKMEAGVTDINFSRLEQFSAIFGVDVLSFFADPLPAAGVDFSIGSADNRLMLDSAEKVIALQREVIKLYEILLKR